MTAKSTQIRRGAALAKEALKLPGKTPLLKVEDMARGNRAMRRAAKKQGAK